MPVDKDINLDKPLSDEDIRALEEEANRLEEIAQKSQEDAEEAEKLLAKEDKLLDSAVKTVDKINKEAEKAEKSRLKIGRTIKEVNQLAEHQSALSGLGGEDQFAEEEREGGFAGFGGRGAFAGVISKGRRTGQGKEQSPLGRLESMEVELLEAKKLADVERMKNLKRIQSNMKSIADNKKLISTVQKDVGEVLQFSRNPTGFLGGRLKGMLGRAGIAGFIAIVALQVAEQVFEYVKEQFGPGGAFDIRKEMLDRDREMIEMNNILDRRAGRVFFTSDTELRQGIAQDGNTTRLRDRMSLYRTIGTQQAGTPDPNDLPPEQKLEFDLPEDELLETVNLIHENNIKDAPVSNPDGVRKINRQDNGLQQFQLTFRGRFKDPSTDIEQAQRFARRLQVEGNFHQFGIFGFRASTNPPSGATVTPFNIDPTEECGLAIKRLTLGRTGSKPKNFDFEIVMSIAGVLPQL
jgi:hypothetical protein